MNQAQAADDFVGRYQGHYIDEDGYYGSQCWDLSARYAREMWGCPAFPTGSGGAEGLWRLYQQPIPNYFDKIQGNDLKKGDIAVWDASFYPPYGHTALVFERNGQSITVLEQDGSYDPNHDDIADGVSYITTRVITLKTHGLRPKKGGDMPRVAIPPEVVAQHYSNYSEGLVSLTANDPACQNRFEDTTDDEFWYGLCMHVHNLLKGQMAKIPNAGVAYDIAKEYGLIREASDPFFARAVGQTEREYRASLAPTIANTFAEMQKQIDNGGSGQQFVETKVYTPKGK